MNKTILIAGLLLLLFNACSNKAVTTWSDEQKMTVEEEVQAQYDKYLTALNQVNFELTTEFFSKDHFISAFAYPLVDPYEYENWINEVKGSFSRRVEHETKLFGITITALAPDLAISTQFGRWKTKWTDKEDTNTIYHASFLWKKEIDGWKIIHVNETGFPNFE